MRSNGGDAAALCGSHQRGFCRHHEKAARACLPLPGQRKEVARADVVLFAGGAALSDMPPEWTARKLPARLAVVDPETGEIVPELTVAREDVLDSPGPTPPFDLVFVDEPVYAHQVHGLEKPLTEIGEADLTWLAGLIETQSCPAPPEDERARQSAGAAASRELHQEFDDKRVAGAGAGARARRAGLAGKDPVGLREAAAEGGARVRDLWRCAGGAAAARQRRLLGALRRPGPGEDAGADRLEIDRPAAGRPAARPAPGLGRPGSRALEPAAAGAAACRGGGGDGLAAERECARRRQETGFLKVKADGTLSVRWIEPMHPSWRLAPVVVLDATHHQEIAERFVPGIVEMPRLDPGPAVGSCHVRQVFDASFGLGYIDEQLKGDRREASCASWRSGPRSGWP